jgi:hypothetical protein
MNRLTYAHKPIDATSVDSVPRLPAAVRRWHAPTVFALIGLCFLLPFATVSCDSARTSFTGVQLVTRAVPKGGAVHEAPDCNADISSCVEGEGSLDAQLALVAAMIGFVLGVLGVAKGPGWCAGVTLGALLDLSSEAVQPFGPDITFHSGLVCALGLSAWAAALHVARAAHRRRGEGAGTVFLALAIAAVVFLITDLLFQAWWAALCTGLTAGAFAWFWYGLPLRGRS